MTMMTDTFKYQMSVMKAYIEGKAIEVSGKQRDEYMPSSQPSFNWKVYDYRVKEIKAEVCWDSVNIRYLYAAKDNDGRWFLYDRLPAIGDGCWVVSGEMDHTSFRFPEGSSFYVDPSFLNIIIETESVYWKNSLIIRPM